MIIQPFSRENVKHGDGLLMHLGCGTRGTINWQGKKKCIKGITSKLWNETSNFLGKKKKVVQWYHYNSGNYTDHAICLPKYITEV